MWYSAIRPLSLVPVLVIMLVVLGTILAHCDGLLVHCLEIYKLLCPLLKLSLKTWLCAEPLNSSGWPSGSSPGSWKCPHSWRTEVAARAQPRIGSAHLKRLTIERKPGNNHRPDDWAIISNLCIGRNGQSLWHTHTNVLYKYLRHKSDII
jgi:hypothetical protein